MLLIHNNPENIESLSAEETKAVVGGVDALMEQLTKSGELLGGEALANPTTTKTVRVVNGAVTTTDGPYHEAKEHISGYVMIDVDSIQRAIEIAGQWPDA